MVNNLDDLTPMIELYNTLISAGRYDEAFACEFVTQLLTPFAPFSPRTATCVSKRLLKS